MKKIFLFAFVVAATFSVSAKDLNVSAGQLESLLPSISDASLTLQGSIDARDFAAIEKLPASVKTLDLGKVKINALTSPNKKYFGRTLFSDSEIPGYSFFKAELEELVLPQGVTEIGEGAFAASSIKSIVIPEGVTTLADYAFYGSDIEQISLPSSLKEIGKGAFGNCASLKSLNLSGTQVTVIPERAFAGSTQLAQVTLPEAIDEIGREAYAMTAVESLDLSNVKRFLPYALSGMPKLTRLTINPSADIAEGMLMDNPSLVALAGSVESVPDYFAANCGMLNTNLNVSGVTELGKYSFANTASSSLILPGSLRSIDRGALSGLIGIETIDVTSLTDQVPAVDEYSFEGLDQPAISLIVEDDYEDVWKQDPYWSLFKIVASSSTNITELVASDEESIIITNNGPLIKITSVAELSDVAIFTADGRVAFMASPGAKSIEIETASLPKGIVVVSASNKEGKKRTVSLLIH